ncbi:MAG: protein kinase [Planctomycetota bacterium]
MPFCPACHRDFDRAETLADVCPHCGATVNLSTANQPQSADDAQDIETTAEFAPIDAGSLSEEVSESETTEFETDEFGTVDLDASDSSLADAGQASDSTIELELTDEAPNDSDNPSDDSGATLDLGATIAGDSAGTVEFDAADAIDATVDLPAKPPTVRLEQDATLELGAEESSGLGVTWGASARRANGSGQTLRADPSDTIGQTVGGFRSSLPIKARSLQGDPALRGLPGDAVTPRASDSDGPAPDYELIDMLGQGGMGVVYAAKQSSIARTVAVKMLKPGDKSGGSEAGSEDQRDKFISEAVITGELEHPNIVPIYDLGANAEGALFYSMKRVKGTPWDDVIAQRSLTENLGILMRVADAVAFAHASGVVHRDLKPENVMLGDYGEVLVMDWGLARVTSDFPSASSVHQSDSLGGTPTYMSPEMARGPVTAIDAQSDVYLLGAMLFEICVGKPPHTGKDVMACLMAAATNKIRPVDQRVEARHAELLAIARRAMASKKADRYAGVKEMQAAVQEYLSHAESVSLATSAEKSLAEARESGQYDLFSRALYGFEESLALWSGNERASSALAAARLEYARKANANGDFDLAESLITAGDARSPEATALLDQVSAARSERDARQGRLRNLKRVALGLLVAVVGITSVAYLEIRRQRNAAVAQREIAEEQRTIADEKKAEAIAQRQIAEEQTQVAVEQRTIAEEQRTIAQEQERIAITEREEADRQRTVAEREREAAVAAREAEAVQRLAAEEAKRSEAYEAYLARIGLAAAKIEENAFDEARTLLDACDPAMRHWEWGRLRYLCGLAAEEFVGVSPVRAAAYSPDGSTLATADEAGTVTLRATADNAAEPQAVRTAALDVAINALAYGPDGTILAAAGADGVIRLLDATTLAVTRSLRGHTEGVLSVDFAADGGLLASAGYDQTVRLWNPTTGEAIASLAGHTWWVWSARFSDDGRRLASAGQDGRVIVWRRSEQGFEPTVEFSAHEGPVYSADFGPRGEIASAGYDRTVRVWRPEEVSPLDIERRVAGLPDPETPHDVLTGHRAPVRVVRFDASGDRLLSGGYDNQLKLWRRGAAERWELDRSLRGHGGRVYDAAIAPDGIGAASVGDDNRTCLWELAGPGESRVLRAESLRGHTDAVLSARYSADGSRIVTTSRDRTAVVWRADTSEQLTTLTEGHDFLATTAIVGDDGSTLVTAGGDGAARVWDLAAGVERFAIVGAGRNAAVAVAESARRIVTGSDDTVAQIWSLDDGRAVATLGGHAAPITALATTPDATVIASGDERGVIRVHRKSGDGWLAAGLLEGHSAAITALKLLPGGERLVSASGDRTCGQWDLATGKEIKALVLKHPDWVTTLDVSPDGGHAVTACADGAVRRWRLADATVLQRTSVASGVTNAVALHPSGDKALLTSASQGAVDEWRFDRAESTAVLAEATGASAVWSAAYGPGDDTVVLVGGNDAELWRRAPAERLMRFSPHGAVADAAISPDGSTIATASWDGSVKLWDAATGKPTRRLEALHRGYLNRVEFVEDGNALLTAGDDGAARLTPLNDADRSAGVFDHGSRVLDTAHHASSNRVATAGADGAVRLWDASRREHVQTLRSGSAAVLAVAFSPDGAFVGGGSEDSTATVWNATSGEVVHRLSAHTAGVTSVAFSPDGARLVTGSRDGAARVWDARTGKEVLTLAGHADEITRVGFHPRGGAILSASRDGSAIVWPATGWSAAGDTEHDDTERDGDRR